MSKVKKEVRYVHGNLYVSGYGNGKVIGGTQAGRKAMESSLQLLNSDIRDLELDSIIGELEQYGWELCSVVQHEKSNLYWFKKLI